MVFRKNRRQGLMNFLFCVVFLFCRHCFERPPPGSDFYALPLPWGALQWRAYACPAWRVMSIAPAGSSSNSVHKKNQDKPLTLSSRRNWGQGRGGGGYWARAIGLYFSVSLSLSLSPWLLIYLCLLPSVFFFLFNFLIICLIEPNHSNLPECLTHFAWHVVEREPGQNNLNPKASVPSPRCGIPTSRIQGSCSRWFHCCVAI